MGVEIRWRTPAVDVEKEGKRITRIKARVDRHNQEWIAGDAFVDATGSAGGVDHRTPYVGRCVMCPWMQCPTFGNRVDISGIAGGTTVSMRQKDGTPGIKYNGLYLCKESLSQEWGDKLEETHQIFVPSGCYIPPESNPLYQFANNLLCQRVIGNANLP